MADVCVVGGGAAGLVAAIVAAESGTSTVVLEQAPTCGRTILATGNGRCNFANRHLKPSCYNDPDFVRATCGDDWLEHVLAFFRASGMAWAEEGEGRLYPLSRQSASVQAVLVQRAQRVGVLCGCAREVVDVTRARAGFRLSFVERFANEQIRTVEARNVIWAVGGARKVPGDLQLAVAAPQPILCALRCAGPMLQELDGRRVHANVSLVSNGTHVLAERGEVLFRPWGLSGIVVFNLSRHARVHDELVVDLLPDLTCEKANLLATHTLDGVLDPIIARELLRVAHTPRKAVSMAKELVYAVEGPADTQSAQVTRGGLLTCQFCPTTLEAHDVPGFFACGEALNVDGPCGGFNLAWAWQSGLVAGGAAARR